MIFTGPSFKHGHVDEKRAAFAELERFASDSFGVIPEFRWTYEDNKPMDHAPFIGWSSSGSGAHLVATAFNAWGISTGTAAAILLADIVTDKENKRLDLFDARRIKPIAGAKECVQGNIGAPAISSVAGYPENKQLR